MSKTQTCNLKTKAFKNENNKFNQKKLILNMFYIKTRY